MANHKSDFEDNRDFLVVSKELGRLAADLGKIHLIFVRL